MDPIVFTPRLKLSLITKAERGSQELEWLHELRSDKQTTWWSLSGQSKSIEDTERITKSYLPSDEGEEKTYRVVYAVHKLLETTSNSIGRESQDVKQEEKLTELVGLVNVKSIHAGDLVLPENLTLPVADTATTLVIEVAYGFLPTVWGHGYASEAVEALYESCKRTPSFWSPFSKLYVRSIVNGSNPRSQRVMDKTGMTKKGVWEWSGDAIFIAGEWKTQDTLVIYGKHLL